MYLLGNLSVRLNTGGLRLYVQPRMYLIVQQESNVAAWLMLGYVMICFALFLLLACTIPDFCSRIEALV